MKDDFILDITRGSIRAFAKEYYITDTQRQNIYDLVPKLLKNPKANISETTLKRIESSLLSLEFSKPDIRTMLKPHKPLFQVTGYKQGYIIEILQRYYGDDCLYQKVGTKKREEYKTIRKRIFNDDYLIDEDLDTEDW